MRLRDSIALTLPSLLLRLVLGVTFLWAGTGKLIGTMQVSGDSAARLANLGIDLDPIESSPAAPIPDTQTDSEPAADPAPIKPLPGSDSAQPAETKPGETKPGETKPAETKPAEDLEQQAKDIVEQIKKTVPPATTNQNTSDEPESPPAGGANEPSLKMLGAMPAHSLTRVQNSVADRTGSDFPEPLECQRVYSIALMISKAADPGLTPDSQPITPTMPAMLATGPWPKVLAWSAAITEVVAGAFLVLGLLTRLSALGTLGVMLVAMWMTQIGPAALHSTDAILGFIPNNQPWYDPGSYSNLLWQLALVSMSLAVMFLGSGAIGLDRLFFSPHPRDPYLHGDPKATKPGKKAMNPASAQRSEFDRSPPPAS